MNTFDAVVAAFAILAVVLGFMSGLLRSLATILAYLIPASIAIAITPRIMAGAGQFIIPPDQAWAVLVVAFIAIGILFGALGATHQMHRWISLRSTHPTS